MNTSSSGISLTPASVQGVGSSAVAAELSHVLSGLQQSGELSTVLQQQPHLVEGMTVHSLYVFLASLCVTFASVSFSQS